MEGEPFLINSTSAIYVPKGVKHGPLIWKKFEKPHLELTIMIGQAVWPKPIRRPRKGQTGKTDPF